MASLELGPSTIQEISKKAQIKRSSTYDLISSLMEKGLMSEFTKGKRRFFIAEKPERLLSLIRIQKKELEEKERGLQRIMPELNNLIELSKGKPKVRFYEGKEGLRSMQEDIFKTKHLSCIEEFIPLDDAYQLFPPHQRDHRHSMLKLLNSTFRKVIYTSKKGIVLPKKEKIVERRFIPPGKLPFSTEINIYGDKVNAVSFGSRPLGMIIEDKGVATSLRSMFYLAWKGAKR